MSEDSLSSCATGRPEAPACSGEGQATARSNGPDTILAIVKAHSRNRGSLIAILEEIQGRYGYLPETALRVVAAQTGQSLVDIYGVATFYSAFSLKPRGKHVCCVCQGTACHVRGAPSILDELEHQLDVPAGGTTKDGNFTLETANCLGACALGPIVVIDGRYFPNLKRTRVARMLAEAKKPAQAHALQDQRIFPIEVACPHCNHSLMDRENLLDSHPSIQVKLSCAAGEGWLRLSSLFGSFTVQSEYPVGPGTAVEFLCPHCNAALVDSSCCPECTGPMALMSIRGGGTARICTRRGCSGHMLDMGSIHL